VACEVNHSKQDELTNTGPQPSKTVQREMPPGGGGLSLESSVDIAAADNASDRLKGCTWVMRAGSRATEPQRAMAKPKWRQ